MLKIIETYYFDFVKLSFFIFALPLLSIFFWVLLIGLMFEGLGSGFMYFIGTIGFFVVGAIIVWLLISFVKSTVVNKKIYTGIALFVLISASLFTSLFFQLLLLAFFILPKV